MNLISITDFPLLPVILKKELSIITNAVISKYTWQQLAPTFNPIGETLILTINEKTFY